MAVTHQTNKHLNLLTAQLGATETDDDNDDDDNDNDNDNDDDDNASQSLFSQDKIMNFLMGAQF